MKTFPLLDLITLPPQSTKLFNIELTSNKVHILFKQRKHMQRFLSNHFVVENIDDITGDFVLNTLVVNISFDLPNIPLIYNCNIITVSYDISFDKGYNYSQPYSYTTLSSLTLLPTSFLSTLDYIFHVDEVVRLYDKHQDCWVVVEE